MHEHMCVTGGGEREHVTQSENAHAQPKASAHAHPRENSHGPQNKHITQRDHARVHTQPQETKVRAQREQGQRSAQCRESAQPRVYQETESIHPRESMCDTDRERISQGREYKTQRECVRACNPQSKCTIQREHELPREHNPERGCKTQRERASVQPRGCKMR